MRLVMAGWTLRICSYWAWGGRWPWLFLWGVRSYTPGQQNVSGGFTKDHPDPRRVCEPSPGEKAAGKGQYSVNQHPWVSSVGRALSQVLGSRWGLIAELILFYGSGIIALIPVPGNLWLSGKGLGHMSAQGCSCQQVVNSFQSLHS